MNQGFYLTLMMGAFNASPVPQPVIDALTDVQVNSTIGSQGGFQLKFTIGATSPLTQMLGGGFFDPRKRVIIAVTVNGATQVLMDGIITKQDFSPSSAAGKSTLSITGVDLTALMDFIDFTGIPYPAVPDFLIVEAILAKYAVLGVKPIAIPSSIPVIENPLDHFVKHEGTDYRFILGLAGQTSAIFYLDPGPTPGTSTAYWGPDVTRLLGGMQPALSINLDGNTNLDSLSFSYDGLKATQYLATYLEPTTKIPIPIPLPNIDILRPSLSQNTAPSLRMEYIKPVLPKSLTETLNLALAYLLKDRDCVSASGQLDVLRYGRVFKAGQRAAVRGAGAYYDGQYYVKSITHNIKRGDYKQSFTLARGGTGSTVSSVSV